MKTSEIFDLAVQKMIAEDKEVEQLKLKGIFFKNYPERQAYFENKYQKEKEEKQKKEIFLQLFNEVIGLSPAVDKDNKLDNSKNIKETESKSKPNDININVNITVKVELPPPSAAK